MRTETLRAIASGELTKADIKDIAKFALDQIDDRDRALSALGHDSKCGHVDGNGLRCMLEKNHAKSHYTGSVDALFGIIEEQGEAFDAMRERLERLQEREASPKTTKPAGDQDGPPPWSWKVVAEGDALGEEVLHPGMAAIFAARGMMRVVRESFPINSVPDDIAALCQELAVDADSFMRVAAALADAMNIEKKEAINGNKKES